MKSIQRHRYFLDFTISSLLRRKWKNISLIAVYSAIVFMITSVLFFANAIRKEAEAVLQDAPEMVIQKMMAGRHDLIPLDYADKIKGIRGVRDGRQQARAEHRKRQPGAQRHRREGVGGDGLAEDQPPQTQENTSHVAPS